MSIKELAAEAEVSMATVSRVFNLPDKVNADTRARVLSLAKRMGYLPNASARSLRTHKSHVLGVVLPTLLNPVFAECLDGIAQAASSAGYAILPVTTNYLLEQEELAVQKLLAANVDGLVLVVSNPAISEALKRLRSIRMPYVLAYNHQVDHPCVCVDSELAVREMVERLIAAGHTRISFVTGQLAASDRAQQRRRGFSESMRAHGLDPSHDLEVPFVETAVQKIQALLKRKDRPTALVCSNDLIAIRCIRAAHLEKLRVPGDLSVTGFDGIALGEDLVPILSTITQPNKTIGSRSVELLVHALSEGVPVDPNDSVVLAHGFRLGESCAGLAS